MNSILSIVNINNTKIFLGGDLENTERHLEEKYAPLIGHVDVMKFNHWEKLPVEQKFKSSDIDNLIKSITDFKENSNKKFSPTGGGLNSILLYIINYDDDELYGRGVYSYSNIDKSYYRINDKVYNPSMEEIVRHDSHQYKCIVVPVSDISVIASKYNEFAFKVANLNLGVALSYILEKASSSNVSVDIVFEFDEEQLLKCFSTTNNSESIGYAVGIKND